jgi:parvulin-like peptidyl-prolyl isomerase
MSRRKWILAGLTGAAMLAGTATGAKAQAPAGAPPAATAPASPAKPPAVVNGEVISRAELDAAIKLLGGGPSPMQLTEDQRRGQQMQVLSLLIDDKVMRQFLAKNAPPATEADVTARVATVEAELVKQKKTLQDFLKESGQSEAAFRGDVAEAVQWDKYARSKISDAAVAEYYKDNKDFFDRVMVRASHIVLRLPPNATEADRAKAKQQLTDLRAQLASNKIDFAEAAKKYSQCPTAPNGGDLGFFPRKFMVDDAFAQAAFATPVNQISDVVQTGYGLHLIKVTERKPGEPSDFAKIKDDVREVYTEEMRMSVLNDLRKSGKIEITLP